MMIHQFQSTPRKGPTGTMMLTPFDRNMFRFHPPNEGGRRDADAVREALLVVSIHAPAKGATPSSPFNAALSSSFKEGLRMSDILRC